MVQAPIALRTLSVSSLAAAVQRLSASRLVPVKKQKKWFIMCVFPISVITVILNGVISCIAILELGKFPHSLRHQSTAVDDGAASRYEPRWETAAPSALTVSTGGVAVRDST